MICVIGDYIMDKYVHGYIEKISPEAPIPIFKMTKSTYQWGGALNVFNNLIALGSEVTKHGSNNSTKIRHVSDNHILFRVDDELFTPNYDEPDYDLEGVKYCILSDYNKGFLYKSQAIVDYCKAKGCIVIVDPKKPIESYKNADLIKLNEKEYDLYVRGYMNTKHALKNNNIKAFVITKGARGVDIVTDKGKLSISTESHQVSDVTGAGDVFIAVMTHFLSKGNSLEQACRKAVKLASISVTKFGTYVLSKDDIKEAYTIFTNGCFDVLHRGHIEYLKESKKLGSKLIVGLNSDKSVKKLKGNTRPLNNQNDRKAVLEAIGFVDEVIIFDEDTPYELIKQIQPDIITKGGDYTVETVVGNDLAEVVIIPTTEGYSTSNLVEKLNG